MVGAMSGDRVMVSIWFDTEDYSDPPSDDAAMRLADILTEQGTIGTFKLVGEKLRALEQRARRDVIAAIAKQDVGYHTDWHSKHPTVPEYLAHAGWDDGVRLVMQYEGPGVADIERVFGQTPSCHGQAGAGWAAQTYAACREWGIPVYLDDGGGNHVRLDDAPHWYCGLLAVQTLGASIVHVAPRTGSFLEQAKARFDAAVEHAKRTGGRVVGVYSHEVEFSHERFADGINFGEGKNPAGDRLVAPPVRSTEAIEDSYGQFRDFVAYIKSRTDAQIVAPAQLADAFADRAADRRYGMDDVTRIAATYLDRPGFVQVAEGWISASEVFSIVLQQLAAIAKGNKGAWVRPVSLLGPKGLADGSYRARATVGTRELTESAGPTFEAAVTAGAVPALLSVGFVSLMPETYLSACCRLLLGVAKGSLSTKTVEAEFSPLAAEKHVQDDRPEIWKWCFAPGFSAPHLMALAKRQAWTLKPATRS